MAPATVGILVNPKAGTDVRRLLASAGTSTIEEKVNAVRRVVIGALESGADRVLLSRDPFRIAGRATETLAERGRVVVVEHDFHHDHRDTLAAVGAFRDAGAGAVVALGGDGTSRAVAVAWPDAVLVPLSTGTNNAFPLHLEATVAGAAAGLVASGRVPAVAVTQRAKVVHAFLGGSAELALVDAVVVDDPHVGSLELFDPQRLRVAVVAVADPASVGFSGVAGHLDVCLGGEDAGVLVEFGAPSGSDGSRRLRVPTAPGHYADVGVSSWRRVALDEPVELADGGVLALDGERWARVEPGVSLTVRRDGPRVVDPRLVMRWAVSSGSDPAAQG